MGASSNFLETGGPKACLATPTSDPRMLKEGRAGPGRGFQAPIQGLCLSSASQSIGLAAGCLREWGECKVGEKVAPPTLLRLEPEKNGKPYPRHLAQASRSF